MKKRVIIILIISILVVIMFMVGLYFYGLTAVSKKSDKVTFNIEVGTSTKNIINDLYEAKIIKSKISTMIYVKLHSDIVIKAGTYEIDRKLNTREIFDILSDGDVLDNSVEITFIEGKKVSHYMEQISEEFGFTIGDIEKQMNDKEYLNKLINEYEFIDESILNSDLYYPLEGYLFPDTYRFYQDASLESIFEKMLDKTESVLSEYSSLISNSGYSTHEILTMASIIENESMLDEDRDEVSQVIHTRLDINMSLGMDVTTYYGVKKELSETLTSVDLNDFNAYNTRRTDFIGLPVGPICNPSVSSIEAALNPSDTDYVYFYADISTGKLHFAKTYNEFQELIRLYS